ncbi:insulinase family protein [Caulobacter sp.]|uniref:M16 family metallopeptidase n=1 Tax=Caulobacter sp. TaxID=78 RepID=UPI001B235AC0|nr:insulinase family protein [Caulobacter sp.]MBO9545595.1 insulinase family protein [Caulobacter sp.]
MISASRLALVAAAGLSVAACSHVPKPSLPFVKKGEASAPAPKIPEAPPLSGPKITDLKTGQWAQELSDVAVDPSWRFGTLSNGMRYAIRKNATPPGQASLRMWFDAGSLMEADDQQGLAHFLEHMAFNGSKNVPEGEMIKILERHGLAFGADTNASTSFDETTYQLDLPKSDDATVDTSLMLLREAAGELTIAPDAVDRERGVVMSEQRTRDTPGYRVAIGTLSAQMEGQLPPKRIPIGKTEILKTAPAQRIRDFYEAYYRPERAVLVAVGDFDVDAMEAKIKTKFGDWAGKGANGKNPDVGPVAKRGPTAKLLVEAGAPWSVQMTWMRKPDGLLETKAVDERDMLENLAFAVLNRRLQAIGRSAEPPFIAGGAFKGDQYGAVRVTTFGATAQPSNWREAMTSLDAEQRRAVQYGVRQDELDREIASLRAALVAAVAGEATQRTPALANQLVGTLGDGEVITSPSQNLAFFDQLVKGLTAERVSAVLKSSFAGSGPLITIASPTAIEGGDQAVLKAYDELKSQPVTPPAAPGVTVWPYSTFGPTGKVAEQKDVTDLDTVFVRFENGVKLTVKPTKFRDDQVLVKVRAGHGLLDMPSDKQSSLWSASAFIEGGLKQISSQDMERVLTGKIWNANLGVEDDAFVLSGRTRPEDLSTELQVLAAFATEPGWRPEAFSRVKTAYGTAHDQLQSTTGGVISRDLGGLMHNGDQRWTFPSREQIAGASLGELRTVVDNPLTKGDLEIIVVGDTTVDKAITAVADTFGALPKRPGDPALAGAEKAPFPAPAAEPVLRTHKGRPDQAALFMAWRTDDLFSNLQRSRDVSILGQVVQLRLIDELREKQGATYSPNASSTASVTFKNWGYLGVSMEVPPEKLDGVVASIRKIAADLRDKPITEDELERAKKPRIDSIEKARVTNEYWLGTLSGAQDDPRLLDATRSVIAGLTRVTPADVQKAARTYLGDDKSWLLLVKPEAAK